jgi:hypothetical protein
LLGVLAVLVGFAVFLLFYLTRSIGNLSANLSFIVDTLVAGLFVAGGALVMEPRIRDWRGQGVIIDELQNPEVRLRVEKQHKERLKEYVATDESKRILQRFRSLKILVDGLTLMDEGEADLKKSDARIAILSDMISISDSGGTYPTINNAQDFAYSAIDMMTLRKNDRIPRKVEEADATETSPKGKSRAVEWQETMR